MLSGGPYTVWSHVRHVCCVAAAVAEAGLMTDEHLTRAEAVADRASAGRVSDPLSHRRLYKVTQHTWELMTV